MDSENERHLPKCLPKILTNGVGESPMHRHMAPQSFDLDAGFLRQAEEIDLTPGPSPNTDRFAAADGVRSRDRRGAATVSTSPLSPAKSHLHVLHPHRYYFHNHRKSDQHSYSQRTRFIPDELLPWFEPVTVRKSTLEFPQGGAACEVATADVRKRIGRMWA